MTLPLLLRASGCTDMIQILLGVLTEHLAFMTANWAFDNNFRTGSRRSIHIGWGHTVQATRSERFLQHESTLRRYLSAFLGSKDRVRMISDDRYRFLRFSARFGGILRLPVK